MAESLEYTVDEGVGLIRFIRPKSRNPLDNVMREEMAALLPQIRADKDLRALVITGDGGAFCAGGDLKFMAEEVRTPVTNRERISMLHTWFPQLNNLELPVIAAVDGPAFGAGFNMALAADFVLCSSRARFCAVFGRIGLVPDFGGFYLLPRLVGLQRAKELILTARSVNATEAVDIGLALSVHEPDQLLDDALAFAGRFRSASRDAVGMAKSILNQSSNLDQRALADMEAFAQSICFTTEYHRDAVQRFLDKEPLLFDWDRMQKESAS